MGKTRSRFLCQECGYESPRWTGRCPHCQQWNTMAEVPLAPSGRGRPGHLEGLEGENVSCPVCLDEVETNALQRIKTGSEELDRVLGGGIVPGAMILLGGDPGIGKSTLVLQVARHVGEHYGTVLYVSGEESVHQLKLRANRLGINVPRLLATGETSMEVLEKQIKELRPQMIVVDSIQTVYSPALAVPPGSLGQVRECTSLFMRVARELQAAVWIIGHVTKEGTLAGPRVLEHIVDVVLYFEGDSQHRLRLLRGVKNRFGATHEVGIFEMQEEGLREVGNPSERLLEERPQGAAGSAIIAAMEGSRALLLEVQALVAPAGFGQLRRSVTGADYNRVSLMIAVLEKVLGMALASQDIFVNIVGGVRVSEPAADLGIALALASSFRNVPLEAGLVAIGEVGLAGEVRSVAQIEQRLREASKLGYYRYVVPGGNLKYLNTYHQYQAQFFGVKTLAEALEIALGGSR